jgi:spore coat protein U-like protein
LNIAEGGGGGVYNQESTGNANLTILQTTINENVSTSGSNLHIHSGTVEIAQSILANSTSSGSGFDCFLGTGTITDQGYNLVEDGSCGFPVGGDPKLLFLANNGGHTPTNALKSDSQALDRIPAAQCTTLFDQRGETRPFGAGCDIGAFELHEQSLNFTQEASSGNFIAPGENITFTIIVEPIGPGISNGTIAGEMSEEFNILGPLVLNPPNAGMVGLGPPILAHSMIISATQVATLTMNTQVALGLAAGIELFNQVTFTSNEVITPVVTTATFTIKNVAPIAVNDSGIGFITSPGLPFTTGNVLDNDYDPNGDAILYLYSTPGNLLGSIQDNDDGTFNYDPGFAFEELPPGATAYDQFTYSITDGVGGIVAATVTITIRNFGYTIFLPLTVK